MEHFELFQSLAVALGVGLLIGIERGWVARNESDGERALGLRTLGLAGLLGGVTGAIALVNPQAGGPMLAGAFVVYALVVALFRYREMLQDRTLGATTVVAALLVYALGVLAVMVDKGIAGAAGVVVAALLALKPWLHAWLRKVTWEELRAGIVLLAMSVILLPALPDRDLGPLGALNPYELWLMTILIAAVSAVGYFSIKLVGEHKGVIVSAVAGGLVSSTAVTMTFARLACEHPEREPLLRAGILASNATMALRVLVVAAAFKVDLLRWLVPSLAMSVLVLLVWIAALHRRPLVAADSHPLALASPFDMMVVLKFGSLLAVVMLASKLITRLAGVAGAFAVAAASGIADVDAITLSMARLSGGELSLENAAGAILLAVAVNSITKVALAGTVGGATAGRRIALPILASVVAGVAGFVLALVLDPLDGALAALR